MSNNFVHNGILQSGLTRRSMVWRQVLQISLQIYYGEKSDRMEDRGSYSCPDSKV